MNLILCCDYGLDDAAATVDALFHARADGYESAFLVAVGGNVPRAVALENAQKLVSHLPFESVPVVIVDTTAEPQREEFLKTVHGGDGMGDLFDGVDQEHVCPVVPFSAFLQSLEGEYDLLSLGPMTLVPRILSHARCRKFVFMGGNIAEEPNFNGYEFNHALDRNAFRETVRAHPHIAVTMDTCRDPHLNVQDCRIGDRTLMHRIVARSREMTFVSGERGCFIWDDIAVKALRHPDWFAFKERTDRDGNVLNVAKYCFGKPFLEIILE